MLFAVYAGLYAARNIPVSGILLAMVVGPWLSDVAVARGFSERMSAVESGLRGHAWIVAAVGVTFLIAVNGGRVGANQLIDAHFDAARMPVEFGCDPRDGGGELFVITDLGVTGLPEARFAG